MSFLQQEINLKQLSIYYYNFYNYYIQKQKQKKRNFILCR